MNKQQASKNLRSLETYTNQKILRQHLNNIGLKTSLLFVVLLGLISSAYGDLLFEDTNFNGGLSAWSQANISGSSRWWQHPPVEANVPGEPSNNLLALAWNCSAIDGCHLTLNQTIDLLNYQNGTVSFYRYVDGQIGSDGFLIVEGFDGSQWIQIASWTAVQGGLDQWTQEQLSLTPAMLNSNFRLRFRSRGSFNAVDNVRVNADFVQGNIPPQAMAGPDQALSDGDGDGIANTIIQGSGTDSDGTIQSYSWSLNGTPIDTTPVINVALGVGIHQLSLTVTDDQGATSTDSTTITVNPNAPPIVNAGSNQSVIDADGDGFEVINLSGSATDSDGQITSVNWGEAGNPLGSTNNIIVSLSSGLHTLDFSASDDGGGTNQDSMTVNVRAPSNQPNIVLIMTDNQEKDSVAMMPYLQTSFVPQAMDFSNAITSFPLCCPSRATFLTGQYAHNHNVLDNFPPNGGIARLDQSNTLPIWLETAGYHTAHIGRYVNRYGIDDTDPNNGVDACHEIPPGWSEWYAITGSYEHFYRFAINNDGQVESYSGSSPPGCGANSSNPPIYQTDLLGQEAVDFINRRANANDGKPFFLNLWFAPPHGINTSGGPGPEPAPRHQGAFRGVSVPQTPSFNEADVSDKTFTSRRRLITGIDLTLLDTYYQRRLESLLSVDESIQNIMQALTATGLDSNTIVVFTSDQGELLGQHRVGAEDGIGWAFEESIKMPLYIQGPGITSGQNTSLVSNIDFASTIMDWAQSSPGGVVDGMSFVPMISNPNSSSRTAVMLDSAWQRVGLFKGVRTQNHAYIEYFGGEAIEFYDLSNDPYQLNSLHNSTDPNVQQLINDMSNTLNQLRNCTGASCIQ